MTQTYRATAPVRCRRLAGTEDFAALPEFHACRRVIACSSSRLAPYYDVPKIHRVVVHGSTQPLEWLKLTIDPDAHYKTTATTFGRLAWQRMPQPQL
jgi:hypothetical protein